MLAGLGDAAAPDRLRTDSTVGSLRVLRARVGGNSIGRAAIGGAVVTLDILLGVEDFADCLRPPDYHDFERRNGLTLSVRDQGLITTVLDAPLAAPDGYRSEALADALEQVTGEVTGIEKVCHVGGQVGVLDQIGHGCSPDYLRIRTLVVRVTRTPGGNSPADSNSSSTAVLLMRCSSSPHSSFSFT